MLKTTLEEIQNQFGCDLTEETDTKALTWVKENAVKVAYSVDGDGINGIVFLFMGCGKHSFFKATKKDYHQYALRFLAN